MHKEKRAAGLQFGFLREREDALLSATWGYLSFPVQGSHVWRERKAEDMAQTCSSCPKMTTLKDGVKKKTSSIIISTEDADSSLKIFLTLSLTKTIHVDIYALY